MGFGAEALTYFISGMSALKFTVSVMTGAANSCVCVTILPYLISFVTVATGSSLVDEFFS